jgi:hypothetical protein
MWNVYFDLTSPSPISLNFEINNFSIRLIENSTQISVDKIEAVNQNAARAKALDGATSCIDCLSWKCDAVLSINIGRLSIEEIDLSGKTISRIGYASAATRAAMVVEGRPQNSAAIKVKKSEAASYYRKGCLSADPFDKFRNFYLAVENISSQIYRKQPGEPEKIELERALEVCFFNRLQALAEVAKAEPIFNTKETAISEVTRILYGTNLCQLNHSKAFNDKKVPFDPENETEVMNALPLVKFVAKNLLEYEDSSH